MEQKSEKEEGIGKERYKDELMESEEGREERKEGK